MNFRPLADNVLVKISKDSSEGRTESGLYVAPTAVNPNPNNGTVVSTGSGTLLKNGERLPIEVNVGDRVLFVDNSGTPVEIDGESYVVLREYDLLGVF